MFVIKSLVFAVHNHSQRHILSQGQDKPGRVLARSSQQNQTQRPLDCKPANCYGGLHDAPEQLSAIYCKSHKYYTQK